MKVIKTLIGIAIAITVFCVMGAMGNDEYVDSVNDQTQTEAYKSFVKDGLIDGSCDYTITKYAVDNDGIAKSYCLELEKRGGIERHYYCVNA